MAISARLRGSVQTVATPVGNAEVRAGEGYEYTDWYFSKKSL